MKIRMLGVACALVIAVSAHGAILFQDNFDVNTSASWNVNMSSADNAATWAYDYSADGIPAAPGGGTIGLKLESNIASPTSVEAITLSPAGQYFSGTYQLKFDSWLNAPGPFPGGGSGSTEFYTCGIGYDDVTVNRGGYTGSGAWFAADGEGGSSRDYRAYKNVGEQFAESGQWFAGTSSVSGGAHNNSDPYYAGFGALDVAATVPVQYAADPNQSGTTYAGTQGFAWHEVTVTVYGTWARWTIDGLPIAQLDTTIGSTFDLDGNISIGYMDIFTSVAAKPWFAFGLVDNLVVTDVPEPSSVALLALGAIAFLRRR